MRMHSDAETPPPGQPRSRLRRVQQAWLGVVFLLGLGYIVLIPPFQTVDEIAHWDRVWTVALGQYNCHTLPYTAAEFVNFSFRFDAGPVRGPIPWSALRDMYEHGGGGGEFFIATAGCGYPPIGYLPAALAAWLLTPEPREPGPHKMFVAFYGGRIANWLLFFGCLVAAFRISLFPMPVLVFASIPMVVHQAISLNNDAVLFSGIVLIGALLTQPPTRARIWTAIALLTLLSAIKPINVIAATLVWLGLAEALRKGTWRAREVASVALASVALPVAAWLVWDHTKHLPILGLSTGLVVPNVNEAAQLNMLLEQPLRVLSVFKWQLEGVFANTPINGGWRGVLLTLGWYKYVVADHVYALAIAALAAGVCVLRLEPRAIPERRTPCWLLLTVPASVLAYAATVTLILYLAFTPVGAETVFGVQGRYFLLPIAMLLFVPAVRAARPLWLRTESLRGKAIASLAAAFFVLSLAAHVAALWAIRQHFWAS